MSSLVSDCEFESSQISCQSTSTSGSYVEDDKEATAVEFRKNLQTKDSAAHHVTSKLLVIVCKFILIILNC